jgi:hypothetical protein
MKEVTQRWSKEGEFADALANGTTLEQHLQTTRTELAALKDTLVERNNELHVAIARAQEWRAEAAEKDLLIHQLGENAASAAREYAERVAVLEEAVERAANVFSDYAELHSAKGTEDGRAKARKNAALAEELRAALTEQPK